MIAQIISHTPAYVWALLAFLVYRGFLASRDRDMTLTRLAIIPLVMVGLTLSGLNSHGPLGAAAWLVWALGMLAGAAVAAGLVPFAPGQQGRSGRHAKVVVNRSTGTLVQRGSWVPLVLMLAIFAVRYAVAMAGAVQPALLQHGGFAAAVTILFGVFNGIFIGRLVPYVQAWLRQTAPVTP